MINKPIYNYISLETILNWFLHLRIKPLRFFILINNQGSLQEKVS